MIFSQILSGLFLLFLPVSHAAWIDPPFLDQQVAGVELDFDGTYFNLKVDEERKNDNNLTILLNYDGTSSFTVEMENKDTLVQFKEDNGKYYLVIPDTPDYDTTTQYVLATKVTITDAATSTPQTLFFYLINIDDNLPQVTPIANSNCTLQENLGNTVVATCGFSIADADGCASSVKFSVAGGSDIFTIAAGSPEAYPACLNVETLQKNAEAFLKVGPELDYETVMNYFLSISYEDAGGNKAQAPISVVFQVIDEPDKPPVWQTVSSTRTVNEETPDSYSISAKDGDLQIAALICYSLEASDQGLDPEEIDYFSINKDSGEVSIKAINRDYWQRSSYTLDLTAYECDDVTSSVPYQTIVQVVDSINKNLTYSIDGADPSDQYPDQEVKENAIDALTYTVVVFDPDTGVNGNFDASLDSDKYMIIPSKGFQNATFTIQGKLPFDYEEEKSADVTLTVQEQGDPTHVLNIPIHIKVLDENDNAPEFQNLGDDNAIHISVREDASSGVIGTILALDKDENEKITYGISKYNGLTIDQSTGDITLTSQAFDYEQQPTVQMQVTAKDNDLVHTNYASLIIDVEDVDDTAPTVRVLTAGSISVPEDSAVGDVLEIQMSASDPDTAASLTASIDWDNSNAYKNNVLVDGSLISGWFTAKASPAALDGSDVNIEVSVGTKLKWDVADNIQLRILVTDEKTDANYQDNKSGYGTVNIIIQDVNDNAPLFSERICPGNWQMKENANENQTIGTIAATDADGPGNNVIVYSIEDPAEERVWIDSSTGLLSTGTVSVDYEKEQSIQVVVLATNDDLKTPCEITINIIDENDVVPEAVAEEASVEIPENTELETFLTFIDGSDGDISEPFHTLRYTLKADTSLFAINDFLNGTAKLSAIVTGENNPGFDYDKGPKSYQVIVVVTDYPDDPTHGDRQLSSSATVTVNLADVNDNAPVFTKVDEGVCFFTTPETTAPGVTLTDENKLEATDSDSGDNAWLTYAIESVECDAATMKKCPDDAKGGLFEVFGNSQTSTPNGKADIRSKTLVNNFGEYVVTISATDHGEGPKSATQKYRFCVTDENNNSPVFTYPPESMLSITIRQNEDGEVVEDSTGEKIPLITATDADFQKNAVVTFSVTPSDTFGITNNGNNEAQLFLREDFAQYEETEITLTACDSPTEGNPNCVDRKLRVLPRFTTEVEPTFAENNQTILFRENATDLVFWINEATDKNNDNAEDGAHPQTVYYYIIPDGSDDDVLDWFTLDPVNRNLSLVKALDASIKDEFTIMVQTTNSDSVTKLPAPKPEALLNITINVEDINDKPPVFSRSEYVVSMSVSNDGQPILTLLATDPDKGDIPTYSMGAVESHVDTQVDTSNLFTLDSRTGIVQLVKYPQATQGYFSFVASASDGEHVTSVNVKIYVVSQQYLVEAVFHDPATEVNTNLEGVVNKFKSVFGYECIPGQVAAVSDNTTTLSVHFEDTDSSPVDPSALNTVRNNYTATRELKNYLLEQYQLELETFGEDEIIDTTDETINTALIAVAAILALLLVLMAAFHFFKTRSLSKLVDRLTNATTPVQEKKGIDLPNTNQHAVVNSNPLWNSEIGHNDLDAVSSSGSDDSDLIDVGDGEMGIDGPAFMDFYQQNLAHQGSPGEITTNPGEVEEPGENPFGSGGDFNY